MSWFAFSIAHPWVFGAGCLLAVLAAAATVGRRAAIHWLTGALCGMGLVLLVLAAGGLIWRRPATSQVLVMVDLSASTRGAEFRQRAALERRIHELLPGTPYRLVYFSDRVAGGAAGEPVMRDMESRRTLFEPPGDAVAIVLFSDGRFELPGQRRLPPVYAVMDPKLDRPADAALTRLEQREGRVAVSARNAGPPRVLAFEGVAGGRTQNVETTDGQGVTFAHVMDERASVVGARLEDARARGDLWPENDALSAPVATPVASQRWYVSAKGSAPPGWTHVAPAALPVEAGRYLAPAVIVLDNIAAGDLSGALLARLEQYARDLGGGLVIAGGDRAFAAGMYTGTSLEALSPLAGAPPMPTTHWILLADASGSMARRGGGGEGSSSWQAAADALVGLLGSLPQQDPVSVGSFSSDVRWWSTGRGAGETARLALPPADVSPSGPTNLAGALERVARESPGTMAGEVLVISDADVTIDRPDEIVAALGSKKLRLHILAIGDERARGYPALADMTRLSGGTILRQADARRWAADVRRLLAAAWPKRLIESSTPVEFLGELGGLPGRSVSPWNRTWLKGRAALVARTRDGAEVLPLGAWWQVGAGRVGALGLSPEAAELEAIAKLVARPPRDPRFAVTWETAGPRLRVVVDAADGAGSAARPLNGLELGLELWPQNDSGPPNVASSLVLQTAPGRYELAVEAPSRRMFAAVRGSGRIIDRVALASRYAEEFESIGNDYDAMRDLARRSGGEVVDSPRKSPIRIAWPRRELDLSSWLAAAGAAMLGLAAARWRWG